MFGGKTSSINSSSIGRNTRLGVDFYDRPELEDCSYPDHLNNLVKKSKGVNDRLEHTSRVIRATQNLPLRDRSSTPQRGNTGTSETLSLKEPLDIEDEEKFGSSVQDRL